MRVFFFAIIALWLTQLSPMAYADDDTSIQMGAWTCTVPAPYRATPFACPPLNFPKTFGAPPNMIITGCFTGGACYGPDVLEVENVTAQGFTPFFTTTAGLAIGGGRYSGNWVAVGPRVLTGTAIAKYIVLTVIYAPPGTNGGHSSSSVAYSSGSTTGTTTSGSQSFKLANSLSFEGSGGFLGNGGGMGLSFEFSHSTTDNQSLEIKKSVTSSINWPGPSQDGIDHDEDIIYLALNPTIDLALSSSSAQWMLASTTSPTVIQYVHVGWLNGHATMPAGVAAALASAGITATDYPDIMARDPLANGSNLDPARFLSVNTTFPYEPPYSATDPVPTVPVVISDSSTETTGSSTEDTYKVGLTLSATGDYLEFAKATLKDTTSWEWTDKSSQSSSTGTNQSATVTIGGPAFGYPGPTVMQVYIDRIYHTFAFALVPVSSEQVAIRGSVITASGKAPPAATEVILTENRITHRTFTDTRGQFVFYGNISGPATVQAAGITQTIPQSQSPRSVQVQVH